MNWQDIVNLLHVKEKSSDSRDKSIAEPCGIARTIIPQEFLDKFPYWDEDKIQSKTKIIIQ